LPSQYEVRSQSVLTLPFDNKLMAAKPTAVDLFCGAGGLSEGLRQAGFRILGAVEIDELSCETYAVNHTGVKLWRTDISRLSGRAIMKALGLTPGQLDLLAACPPCQGFSAMRTKNGARWNKDPRNDLISEVLRIIRALRPKSVMLENVPRLAANRRYSAFRKGLEALGYHVTWDILNVADFGVPQSRKRLVLLASKFVTPTFAPKARNGRTVRDAIGNLRSPTRSRDPLHNYTIRRSQKVVELIREIPGNGGSRSALSAKRQLECHKKLDGFRDVYGRMSWDRPAPTITGGCINPSKGRFLHPRANRAITLREAALLQSFPKSYRFRLKNGRYSVALLIGNALPPEFIRRHATALKHSLPKARGNSRGATAGSRETLRADGKGNELGQIR
jgi:DNA (cytosine-5)-methyltransferase 1